MLPTVADLLGLDVIRRGSPRVVTGPDGLDAQVRWVHVLELADAAHLLRGGELVLTTGVALPDRAGPAGPLRDRTGRRGGERAGGGARPPVRRDAARGPGGERGGQRPDADRLRARGRVRRDHRGGARPDHRRAAGGAARLRADARGLHRAFRGRRHARRDRPAGRDPGRAAGDPGRPVAPGPGLRARPGRPRAPARGVRAAEPGAARVRAHGLRRGLGLAVHAGRRAGRGLGPGHPGLRPAAARRRHRAHRAGRHHAGPRPPAHPARREPGPAGPPDPHHRHHQPGPRRPGRGRGAGPGARRPGGRPPAHRHGAAAA